MGMMRMFWPKCDGCCTQDDGYSSPYASEVREKMKQDGWTVNNKLICPDCNGSNHDYWKDYL